jgi:hypothetical protein
MILRTALIASSLTLISSCSSKDSNDSPGAPPSDDASGFSVSELDPAKAPALDDTSISTVLDDVSAPIVPNFSNSSLALTGQKLQLRSEFFAAKQVSDTFSECVDKTPPSLDQVTASGSKASVNMKYDWSTCLKDAVISAGGIVSTAVCKVSAQMSVSCPSKDYNAADGKKYSDAKKDLGMGVSDCNLADGAVGSVKHLTTFNCSFAGTLGGKPVSLNSVNRSGFMNRSGEACEFRSSGGQMIFGDCIDATSKIRNDVDTSGERTSEHHVARHLLKDAKFAPKSVFLSGGQTFGFDVNNWKGTITTGSSSATYSLSNGSEAKTGELYP